MSIYATFWQFGIKRFGDQRMVEILAQSVPPHIVDVGPAWEFLPPPVDPDGRTPRAVFFVEPGDAKGTARSGQEYIRPLLVLTGKEYESISFDDLMLRLEERLDKKYGDRPNVIARRPDGSEDWIY